MVRSHDRRLDRIEEAQWHRRAEALDRYLERRSVEDVEFFCAHGYLPEVPIPGNAYIPASLSWKEHWKLWKEHKRIAANRTADEREFFCAHGYWPVRKE